MEVRNCSFCGSRIEPGTGKMFIKRDGSVLYFDSSKCEKNYLKIGREPRRVPWTSEGREEKKQRIKFARDLSPKPEAPKVEDLVEKKQEEDEGKKVPAENKG